MPPCSASARWTVRVDDLDKRFHFDTRPAEHSVATGILHVEHAGQRGRLVRRAPTM
jgi:hypothetical protein